jgi:RNase P/RNase MRP subunit p29
MILSILVVEVSRLHSDTPRSVGVSGRVISPSQRPLLSNTNTHKRQISMSPAGFEFAFPTRDRTQTHAFRMRDEWDRQLYLGSKLFSDIFSYVVT